MNTQSLDLNKMGLAPMDSFEMQEVDGGFWQYIVKAVEYLGILDAANDLASGITQGYNQTRKK